MGLDMYLHRKVYVGNKWREPEQQLKVVLPKSEKGVTFPIGEEINQAKISSIEEEVGYWRKANAIHEWFCNELGEAAANCQDAYVEREQLEKLLDIVNKVLEASELVDGDVTNGYSAKAGEDLKPNIEKGKIIKDPTVAKELLPTESGPFFGGTDYDQWYYEELVETKEILEKALKYEHGDFYYYASW